MPESKHPPTGPRAYSKGRTGSGGGLGSRADEGVGSDGGGGGRGGGGKSVLVFTTAPLFLEEDWGREQFLPLKAWRCWREGAEDR